MVLKIYFVIFCVPVVARKLESGCSVVLENVGLGNSCGLDSDGLRPRNKYRPQSKLTIIISRSSRLLVVISLLFFKINNRNAVT